MEKNSEGYAKAFSDRQVIDDGPVYPNVHLLFNTLFTNIRCSPNTVRIVQILHMKP